MAVAAARHGVQRIGHLTGILVREEYGPKIPEHRAKLAAEQAIQASGVPYTFFRPTYFTNTLPRHVQGPLLVALGRQRRALHPVCAEDFAVQVAHAFTTPQAANRDFYIHGPEQLTLHHALDTYRQIVAPDKRMVTIPLPVMETIDRFFMGGKLAPNLQIMRLLAPSASAAIPLPPAACSARQPQPFEAWCHAQASTAETTAPQAVRRTPNPF